MRQSIDYCYAITHNKYMDKATSIIKQLRSLGLSQSEIARRVGIPQSRVSRWESGQVPTGADDALRLADLLKTIAVPSPELATQQEAEHA